MNTVALKSRPQPNVVAVLEEAVRLAQAGEIHAVAIAWVGNDTTTGTHTNFRVTLGKRQWRDLLAGATSRMLHDIHFWSNRRCNHAPKEDQS